MYSDGRSGRLVRCKRVLDSCRTLSKAPHGPDTSSPRPPASPNRNQRFLGSRTRKAAVHSRTAPAEAALLGPLVDGALLLAGQHQTAACCLTPAELNASAATSARCRPTPSKTQRTWPGHRLQASYLTKSASAAGQVPPVRNQCSASATGALVLQGIAASTPARPLQAPVRPRPRALRPSQGRTHPLVCA